jgi:excisionase family DNA binding protein
MSDTSCVSHQSGGFSNEIVARICGDTQEPRAHCSNEGGQRAVTRLNEEHSDTSDEMIAPVAVPEKLADIPSALQLVSIDETAALLSVTRRFVYALIEQGELATVSLGRHRAVPITEIAVCSIRYIKVIERNRWLSLLVLWQITGR